MRVALISDFPTALRRRKRLYLGEAHRPVDVLAMSVQGPIAIVQLAGVDTPEQAAALREQELFVAAADAVRPRRGEHYWHQIVGLRVVTTDGRDLGTVREILRTGSNDVYVVAGARGELLVPAIRDVVKRVDVAAGRMEIEAVPGLLDPD